MAIARRQFCTAAAAAALGQSWAAAGGPRPNILWITSEDNGPFLGCFGDAYARTPNLDRLAAQGTAFDHAYSAFPVCAPTRSTLITGVCANSAGTGHMRSMVPLSSRIRMLPELLRGAGYHCTNNVKEDYNTRTPDSVWDESSRKATYRSRAPGQPFFHVINFTTTHESSMFQPRELEHDPERAPHWPYHPRNEVFRRDRARYADNLTRMDAQAGQILAQLEADGLAEDTIVFYFSDHGGIFPRSKRFVYDSGIRVPLIIRVPKKFGGLASTPPGGRTDRLVSFVDFAPTILSLADVPIPEYMQGRAFLGSQAAAPREYVFAARDRMGPCPDLIRAVRDKRYKYIRNFLPHLPAFQYDSYAMGIPSWANIWQLHREGRLDPIQRRMFEPKPAEELYDTRRDPHEIENVAGRPELRDVLAKMRAACDEWLREIHDVSFIPELEMHRLSAGSTPYDLARDPVRYPIDDVLRLAGMAAAGEASNLPLLKKHLDGGNTVLQYWAAVGCRVLDGRSAPAREALSAAMKNSPSPSVRMAAAEVLCRLGDCEQPLEILKSYLASPEPWTRMHAAVTLGWLGERARPAGAALEKAAADTENYPKLAAQNALLNVK
jgi:arylsulfatase A-like enzyme